MCLLLGGVAAGLWLASGVAFAETATVTPVPVPAPSVTAPATPTPVCVTAQYPLNGIRRLYPLPNGDFLVEDQKGKITEIAPNGRFVYEYDPATGWPEAWRKPITDGSGGWMYRSEGIVRQQAGDGRTLWAASIAGMRVWPDGTRLNIERSARGARTIRMFDPAGRRITSLPFDFGHEPWVATRSGHVLATVAPSNKGKVCGLKLLGPDGKVLWTSDLHEWTDLLGVSVVGDDHFLVCYGRSDATTPENDGQDCIVELDGNGKQVAVVMDAARAKALGVPFRYPAGAWRIPGGTLVWANSRDSQIIVLNNAGKLVWRLDPPADASAELPPK